MLFIVVNLDYNIGNVFLFLNVDKSHCVTSKVNTEVSLSLDIIQILHAISSNNIIHNEIAEVNERINKNREDSCQRERCLHNIWKFRSYPLVESQVGETSQETSGGAKRTGQSRCAPTKGGRKIRRIRESQEVRRQPESLGFRDSLRFTTVNRCRYRVSFSQSVLKVVSFYLFKIYAPCFVASKKADA